MQWFNIYLRIYNAKRIFIEKKSLTLHRDSIMMSHICQQPQYNNI